ncbi:hypothetical protein D3C78_1682980 [compost metagenome]
MPSTPQARPTIFWARVKPLPLSTGACGLLNRVDGARPSSARAFSVRPRPMISGIRPPARTSSSSTSVFSSKVVMTSSVPCLQTLPA